MDKGFLCGDDAITWKPLHIEHTPASHRTQAICITPLCDYDGIGQHNGIAVDIDEFEHVLRASAGITGETVFVVVGSQAVLAQYPNPPPAMKRSVELDIYPRFRPDLAEVIEGAIGADSPFHGTFGYHADGVSPETAKLPRQWEDRAIRFTTRDGTAVALCPEIHDLAVAKLLAGRPKDLEWLKAGIEAKLIQSDTILALLPEAEVGGDEEKMASKRLLSIGNAD